MLAAARPRWRKVRDALLVLSTKLIKAALVVR